ncbi:uncharacterized [Tachysurus ichikawai]
MVALTSSSLGNRSTRGIRGLEWWQPAVVQMASRSRSDLFNVMVSEQEESEERCMEQNNLMGNLMGFSPNTTSVSTHHIRHFRQHTQGKDIITH